MTRTKAIAACAAILALSGGASAGAHSLLTGKDIRNGSIAERDLSSGVRHKLAQKPVEGPQGPSGAQGAMGPQGPAGKPGEDGLRGPQGLPGTDGRDGRDGRDGAQGPAGPQGDTGAPGQDGVSGLEVKSGTLTVAKGDQVLTATVVCPPGKSPLGGGGRVESGTATLIDSYPDIQATTQGWIVDFQAVDGAEVHAYVTCAIAP